MVGGLWFLLALGATGLHVETDTPDALCPPLEPVRQAVRSRLGEVEGGPYEARFAVVRGGNRESDVLVLTLREADGEELLRRELPLASLGCNDAAEVIALVLERFFQQMSGVEAPLLLREEAPPPPTAPASPEPPSTAPSAAEAPGEPAPPRPSAAEPVQPEGDTTPDPSSTPPTTAAPPSATPPADGEGAGGDPPPAWSLRGNIGLHSTLVPGAGLGAGFRPTAWLQLVLDTTWPIGVQTLEEQGLQLSTNSSWLFGSGLFLLEQGPWSVGAGPAVGLELQQAEIEGAPGLSAGRKARLLFGVGAHAVGRFLLSDPLELELGVRALPMITGAAREFAVRGRDGGITEVLRPPSFAWTVSLGLNVRLGGEP